MTLIFDAGPVISFTTNNLLSIAEELKKKHDGDFIIPESVKKELVDNPLQIKRFEFEALQVEQQIECGTFRVLEDSKTREYANKLLGMANSLFRIRGNPIKIVHYGEISTIAAARHNNSDVIVMDERTTRELIENPEHLASHMKEKFRTKVTVNNSALSGLKKEIRGIKVIRSAELIAVAFELGLLDRFIDKCRIPDTNVRKLLLDSVLWGVKLEGCSISKEEIEQIMKLEKL